MFCVNTQSIISFGKRRQNLLGAVEAGIVGSSKASFKDYISNGTAIYLHCEGLLWGSGRIEGEYFFSDDIIWDDKLYPHRFRFSLTKLLADPIPLNDGIINSKLRTDFGPGWPYM